MTNRILQIVYADPIKRRGRPPAWHEMIHGGKKLNSAHPAGKSRFVDQCELSLKALNL